MKKDGLAGWIPKEGTGAKKVETSGSLHWQAMVMVALSVEGTRTVQCTEGGKIISPEFLEPAGKKKKKM